MASIYKISEEYADLLSALEFAESEEETAELWQKLLDLEGDIVDKAEIYARIIRNKQIEADGFKAEKQRLEKCQKSAENVIERLKQTLLNSMQLIDVKEIQTGIGKWRIQLNPPSCQIMDESEVPEEFHIPQPDKIDRTGILKHFKDTGELLPGVEITQNAGIRFR